MLTIDDFYEKDDTPVVTRTPVELEVWRRIKLSIAAYSYEFCDDAIMSDAEFDKMCMEINPSIKTGNKIMDNFFEKSFDSSTGQWIHKHPQIDRIKHLYETYYRK